MGAIRLRPNGKALDPGLPSVIEQRRHVDEVRLQHASPTTRVRAHRADRLVPRRRHLPICLWCPVAVEGIVPRNPHSDPRPYVFPTL